MALVVPSNKGEILMLQYIVGMVSAGSPVLHLYLNNVTPDNTVTINTFQEATSAGYAYTLMASANWTTTQSLSGVTTALYSAVTFTFNTNAVIYGYYVTDNPPNNAMWCERFSGAPFQIPDGGGTITLTPKITLS